MKRINKFASILLIFYLISFFSNFFLTTFFQKTFGPYEYSFLIGQGNLIATVQSVIKILTNILVAVWLTIEAPLS
ncbi:hypothetical protein KW795_02690, partial [Candidatus Microgenomates bacterium]|nr:hypothetical protein [Candidatus Microgenomates bacterium]